MRELVYFIASSLDGFIADPEGNDPTGPGGFWPIGEDYVAHLVSEYPETLPGAAREAMGIAGDGRRFDTVLEGRRTHEVGLEAGVTDAYPHLRHFVFSRTIESSDPRVTVVDGDPVAIVRELKGESSDRDIWLVGGGDLAGTLLPEIDRLVVKLAPVTIGAGTPLFGRHVEFAPQQWRLADHTVLASGTIFLTYERRAD